MTSGNPKTGFIFVSENLLRESNCSAPHPTITSGKTEVPTSLCQNPSLISFSAVSTLSRSDKQSRIYYKRLFITTLVLLVVASTVGMILTALLSAAVKGSRRLFLILQQLCIILSFVARICHCALLQNVDKFDFDNPKTPTQLGYS